MFETLIFNTKQRGLAFIGKPPMYCHYPKRKQFCSGCKPGDIFQCVKCNRLVPYCMGASDDREDWCDTCVRIEKIQIEMIAKV